MSLSQSNEKQKEIWRKASLIYYLKNKEEILEKKKKYGKEYFADATRKYAHNNKDKIREKAKKVYHRDKTKALTRAKTNYSIKKMGTCFNCKEKKETQFHHLTYKPNKFIEVCKKCHNKMHGRNYYGR